MNMINWDIYDSIDIVIRCINLLFDLVMDTYVMCDEIDIFYKWIY